MPPPPQQLHADELTTLTESLDRQRAGMVRRFSGLTAEQVRKPLPPSSLTLAGLLKHLALVEDFWFQTRFRGRPEHEHWPGVDGGADPDWEFRTALDDPPEQLLAWYQEACARSRAVVAEVGDLEARSAVAIRAEQETFSLRWALIHMIEETARHRGHADFIRESIDGDTSF